MSFDLFYPNEGNAPRWQLITRLEQAAPPDSAIPDASVLNTVSIVVPSEQLRHLCRSVREVPNYPGSWIFAHLRHVSSTR